jgi:hypothetical protein
MNRIFKGMVVLASLSVLLTLSVIGCGSGSDDSKSTASVNPPPVQTTPTNTPSTTPVPTTPTTTPTPESPLVSILINEERSVSEDKRSDSYFLGVKTGCYGNTFSVSIKITDVSVQSQGNTNDVKVTYSGSYSRKNFVDPCVQAFPEDFGVSGQYSFRIIQNTFKTELIGGMPSNLMKYGDPNHDSNLYAIRAVREAICLALDKTPDCLGTTI